MIQNRSMKGSFCAICGKTNVPLHEALCNVCYWKEHQSIKLKQRQIELDICTECGAVKLPSGWTNSNNSDQALQAVLDNLYRWVDFDPDVEIETILLSKPRWEDGKPNMIAEIIAYDPRIEMFPIHEEHHEVEIQFLWGICKACAVKKTGGSVTFQLRTANRQMTMKEMNEFERMVTEIVQRSQPNNPMSFVVSVMETKYGLDLKLASRMLAENILSELKKKWAGKSKKNFKLVGEDKDGIRKYAVTYLYRIPGVVRGDYIIHGGDLMEVMGIDNQGVEAYNFSTSTYTLIRDWENLKIADPSPRLIEYLVVSHDRTTDSYELMDLSDYHAFEIDAKTFPKSLPIGETVVFLEWEDKLFLTRTKQRNIK